MSESTLMHNLTQIAIEVCVKPVSAAIEGEEETKEQWP